MPQIFTTYTFTQYDVLPHNKEIIDYCDVTAPYVFFLIVTSE